MIYFIIWWLLCGLASTIIALSFELKGKKLSVVTWFWSILLALFLYCSLGFIGLLIVLSYYHNKGKT